MMNNGAAGMERALRLAAVAGLRSMAAPAMLAAVENNPRRDSLVVMAVGEMLLDKLPLVPGRDTIPMLIQRGIAGAWVAQEAMRNERQPNRWIGPLGALVAIGVAASVPKVRRILNRGLGIPDPILGLAEDYCAIRCGSEALGVSVEEMGHACGLIPQCESESGHPPRAVENRLAAQGQF